MEVRRGATESVEAVVIGGGVVGCAILLELAVRGIDSLLLEAEPDVGEGTSKANSAILHTGFDAKPGTTEARLLRRSASLWPGLLEALGVPSLQCGAVMLAQSRDDAARLGEIAALAADHGVATEVVDDGWLREAAPYVTERAMAALYVPDEGIVDPFWLTRAYADAAARLGARLRTQSSVVALDVGPDDVALGLAGGERIRARQAFLAAGIRSDEVAALAGDASFTLTPRKGEFLVSEHTAGVDRIVLPIPGPLGKGMLVTPIVFGGVLLGPTADDGDDKSDRSTTTGGRERILSSCRTLVPAVDEMAPIRCFAGVRAVSSTGDYIIRPSTAGDRLTIVAGIRSTGISASPGIAEAAVEIAATTRGWTLPPARRPVTTSGQDLTRDATTIVCVCRSIGDAEVAAALAGPAQLTTTDALKRRCGAGFGDCQGNRCLADVIATIEAAVEVPVTSVEKGPMGSWLVAPALMREDVDDGAVAVASGVVATGARGDAGDDPYEERDDPSRQDVVIVGGGLAGIGSAIALVEAGLDVAVVDRGQRPGGALAAMSTTGWTDDERAAVTALADLVRGGRLRWLAGTTVVGLSASVRGWSVELLGRGGSRSLEADAILLATGGYVTPREHDPIAGPRPSGVMTADFALDALARGWLPGHRLVVVGSGRLAVATAGRLTAAGAAVIPLPGRDPSRPIVRASLAVRGQPRLSGVAVDGAWLEADGLVLADRLSAATFLLRGLGIGDDRPGVPAPVDDRGALPIAGAWAAGSCVRPDVDHVASLAAGRAIAATIVGTMRARTPA